MTLLRLSDPNTEEVGHVVGMDQLRHAYLELAPELKRRFVTGHHDDEAGILQTHGLSAPMRFGRFLAGALTLVAAITVGLPACSLLSSPRRSGGSHGPLMCRAKSR